MIQVRFDHFAGAQIHHQGDDARMRKDNLADGLAGFEQPFRLLQMPALQATFAEWISPDFQKSPALEVWLLDLCWLHRTSIQKVSAKSAHLANGSTH